ncbi:hypothetical protein VTO42DRAFT_1427 [Malbranchea cinnamomea]
MADSEDEASFFTARQDLSPASVISGFEIDSFASCDCSPVRSSSRRCLPDSFTSSTYPLESSFEKDHARQVTDGWSCRLSDGLPSLLRQMPPVDIPQLSASDIDLDPEYLDRKRQWNILSRMRNIYEGRETIGSQRFALKQQRTELRLLRERVAELGSQLVDLMTINSAKDHMKSEDVARFGQLCKQFRDQTDKYLIHENKYNEVEGKLDTEEFRLEEAEKEIVDVLENSPQHDLGALFGEMAADEKSSTSSTASVQPEYHPLVEKYFSRLGQINYLKETLWELRAEHEALLHEQEMRQQYGLSLGADDLAILDGFEQDEAAVLEELEEAEKYAQQLKMECDAQGLAMDKLGSPASSKSEETDWSSDFVCAVDPLWSWKKNCPSFFERPTIVNESVDMANFINKWLLDQLCQSSFAIFLYRVLSPTLEPLHLDTEQLQKCVVDFWERDVEAPKGRGPSCAEGSIQSVHVSNANPEDGGELEIEAAYFRQPIFPISPNGRNQERLETSFCGGRIKPRSYSM